MDLHIDVPPNTTAVVVRPGLDEERLSVTSATHRWSYAVADSIGAVWADEPSAVHVVAAQAGEQ
jgi:hypothetical protein